MDRGGRMGHRPRNNTLHGAEIADMYKASYPGIVFIAFFYFERETVFSPDSQENNLKKVYVDEDD